MLTVIFSLLGKLGASLIGVANQHVDADKQIKLAIIQRESEQERVRAEVATAIGKQQASLIKTAMSHQMFWVVWSLFAVPLGVWWALVMIDTMTPPDVLFLGIPALPQTIQPYADMIFNNVFYSGAGLGAVQILGRAALGRKP